MTFWPAYLSRRGEIAGLLDPRCYTMNWLDSQVWCGRIRCWHDDDALILAEVRMFPAGAREIHGMIAVGDLGGILGLIEQAEQWAINENIEFATIASRAGWSKVLKSRGYAPFQIELRKELTRGVK